MKDYYSKTNSQSLKNNPKPKSTNYTSTQPQFNKTYSQPQSEFLSKALSERDSIIISNNIIPNEEWQFITNHIIKSQNIQTNYLE